MIGISLIVIAGLCKSLMDLSSEDFFTNQKDFYNKSKSWKHKWKLDSTNEPIKTSKGDNKWYLGINTPKYIENFPFSSTILVMFTDFWHLIQFAFITSLIFGVYLYEPLVVFSNNPLQLITNVALIYLFMLLPFELLYNFLKKTKK